MVRRREAAAEAAEAVIGRIARGVDREAEILDEARVATGMEAEVLTDGARLQTEMVRSTTATSLLITGEATATTSSSGSGVRVEKQIARVESISEDEVLGDGRQVSDNPVIANLV